MKKFIILFSCLSLVCPVYAQFSSALPVEKKGFSIGVEKNFSAFLEYGWTKGFHVAFKHTVIADKLEYQSFRFEGGYVWRPKFVDVDFCPFAATDWKASFVNVGMKIILKNSIFSDKVRVGVQYIPVFDNETKFLNGWSVGVEGQVHKNISIFAEYGNYPDFRVSYKRLYAGLSFCVKNLQVRPMFEMPFYDSGLHPSHGKVVVNVCYMFEK